MAAIVGAGCAPRAGWQRTDRRTCAADEAPRVCVAADPDRQLVVRAGGETLVPGECMTGPSRRGGRLRVAVDDGRAGRTTWRWVRVGGGQVTTVGLEERRGESRVSRARAACER
ncbi:MAG: hypothetical protein JNL82_07735 [Myxococcales bacterium]|nr:hypothetical protein [Myxococcales bacterium]